MIAIRIDASDCRDHAGDNDKGRRRWFNRDLEFVAEAIEVDAAAR
ncbi:hypothetical protein Poly51_27390 [Rubripirellula tenax]|uniref:Uncharacterized protein n=1 Tax=Rubripirellula tenax TaxID=2528015 RepID=A0A5C6F774_9BACT|nr:hypothetical protein Poly51_27390 [Rubripirellula tenax]